MTLLDWIIHPIRTHRRHRQMREIAEAINEFALTIAHLVDYYDSE